MGMTAGIKLYGTKGVESILKETKKFHDREVVKLLNPKDITPDIRARVLGYLMFLKNKRNRQIKARGCADGRPQRL